MTPRMTIDDLTTCLACGAQHASRECPTCRYHPARVSACCGDTCVTYDDRAGTPLLLTCGNCGAHVGPRDHREPLPEDGDGPIREGDGLENWPAPADHPADPTATPPDAYDGPERNLQAAVEATLRQRGYTSPRPDPTDAGMLADGLCGRVGWYVHLHGQSAKGNAQLPDLLIGRRTEPLASRDEYPPRVLYGCANVLCVELKTKGAQWQPGQRERVRSGEWALAWSEPQAARILSEWERANGFEDTAHKGATNGAH